MSDAGRRRAMFTVALSISLSVSLSAAPLLAQYSAGNIHKPRQMTPKVPIHQTWMYRTIGFSPNTGSLWAERSGRDIGVVTWTSRGNPVYTPKMAFTPGRTHFSPFVFRRGDPKDGIFFIEVGKLSGTVDLMFWNGTKLVTQIAGLPALFNIFDADLTHVFGVNQIRKGFPIVGTNLIRIRQDGSSWSVDMARPLGLYPGSIYTYPGMIGGPSFDRGRSKLAFRADSGGLRPHNEICYFTYRGVPSQRVTVLNPTAYNAKGSNFKLYCGEPKWINDGNSLAVTYRDAPLTSGRVKIGRLETTLPTSFRNYTSNPSSTTTHLGVSNDGQWLVYVVDSILPFAPGYERVPAMMHWSGGGEILMDVHRNYQLLNTASLSRPQSMHMHVASNGKSRIAFTARPDQSAVYHVYGVEPENELVVRPRLELGQQVTVEMQNLRSILAFLWLTRQNVSLPQPFINKLLIGAASVAVLSSGTPNTRASLRIAIPNDIRLMQIPFYFQGVTQEPGASFGLRLSRLTRAWAVR